MDLEELHAASDAHAERQARIRALAASSAETRVDMEARRARRLAGEEPAEWKVPQPAPRPAAVPVQKAAPPMPAETQAAWDRWAKAHIRNALVKNNRELVKAIGEAMATYVGKRLDGFADVRGKEVAAAENRLRDEDREARGKLLTRIMALEAERAGRAMSRIYDAKE